MLAIARRNAIKRLIELQGEVSVVGLSKKFEVSETTIRRDLDVLEENSILKKTYGGAVIHEKYLLNQEPLFNEREQLRFEEKKFIAELATSMIEDGDVIILDGGTTTSYMVPFLKDKKDLVIVTNAINIAYELTSYQHIEVIVLGGSLRHRTSTVVGPSVINALESIWADKLFMSCSGVSVDGGITVPNLVSLETRQRMMKSANTTILLADSSKIGKRHMVKIASLEEVSTFITNEPFEQESIFRSMGIKVLHNSYAAKH